jgi:hypothetical protein
MAEEQKAAAEAPSSDQAQLSRAADRLRDSAKWLIASFGAAAAVVVAGISLSDLGKLSPSTPGYRLAMAVAGALAAVVGVLGALTRAMSLATGGTVTVTDLKRKPSRRQAALRAARETVAQDPALAWWEHNLASFVDAVDKARDNRDTELDAYVRRGGSFPSHDHLDRATFQVAELEGVLGRLLETASFLRLEHRFRTSARVIAGWLLVAAVGVLLFVYAVQTGPAALDVPAEPVAATLRTPADDHERLAEELGPGCGYDLAAVPVVVLSVDAEAKTAELVTVPAADCAPVRWEAPRDSVAQAIPPSSAPTPSTTR